MTALIIIGIILGALVLHFTIGGIAALKLAPKVAELSMKTTIVDDSEIEYEWENNRTRDDSEYQTKWLADRWKPINDIYKWQRTGKIRGGESFSSPQFDSSAFKAYMAAIRWIWFIAIPATLAASSDKKMLEKYDPAVAERKEKQLQSRIDELEKELEIEQ